MADEVPSDHSLLRRLRQGQDDGPTLLYLRYADQIRKVVARQSSHDLSPRVDPEDIVQSVFRTFFRRAAEGQYDVPEGEEIWKLLLVIALNKVRPMLLTGHGRTRWRTATQRSSQCGFRRTALGLRR